MRRILALLLLVSTTGCFRYAPVTSLDEINDDRVQVIWNDGKAMTLTHATASGHTIVGERASGEPAEIDATDGIHVRKRKLDGAVTAGIIAGSVVVAAGIVGAFLLAIIASASQPVLQGQRGF